MKKTLIFLIVAGVAVFGLIQLIPYGQDHTNPPVVQEPPWDSPETRLIAKDSCFDCHSNETVWPWYSNIAPVSWLIYNDVQEGRDEFNFSDWGNNAADYDEIIEKVQKGSMPPGKYLLMHPNARLSDAQKETFIKGIEAMMGK